MKKPKSDHEQHSASDDRNRLVYSTELGDLRKVGSGLRFPTSAGPSADAKPKQSGSKPGAKPDVIVRLDTKGRRGKTVTLVENLPLTQDQLAALAHDLKSLCGTGGSLEERSVMLQGDHREKVATALRSKGHPVKVR